MSAPKRTVTLETAYLEGIEDRIVFLAETLQHQPAMEKRHIEGLALILGDIALHFFAVLHENDDERPAAAAAEVTGPWTPAA
jgi:hypothetical protein